MASGIDPNAQAEMNEDGDQDGEEQVEMIQQEEIEVALDENQVRENVHDLKFKVTN